MISILDDKLEEFEPLPITEELINTQMELNLGRISKKHKPSIYLYRDRNKWYFCKRLFGSDTYINFLNELIGMYYAKLLDANPVDYIMRFKLDRTTNKKTIFLLSENFWKKNSIEPSEVIGYQINRDKRKTNPNMFLELNDFSRIKNPKLDNGIMKMTAIDIIMHQTDRGCWDNCSLIKSKNQILLDKLFDFGCSYEEELYDYFVSFYENPFLSVRLSEQGLIKLFETFTCAYPIFKTISLIELKYILSLIEKDYPIIISEQQKQELFNKDKSYRKIIQKALR